jgi:hypothetical protein
MNIFVLDRNLEKCAQYHYDKHVIKMQVEYTQMLCTAHHVHGSTAPYKPTHAKHPSTLWVCESQAHWVWMQQLLIELNKEHRYRYGAHKRHKSAAIGMRMLPPDIKEKQWLRDPPQAMPDEFKDEDVVKAYRRFYTEDSHKIKLSSYKRRALPDFYSKAIKRWTKKELDY